MNHCVRWVRRPGPDTQRQEEMRSQPPTVIWIRTMRLIYVCSIPKGSPGRERIHLWCRRRRQWHPTPVLLPGKSHGRRSLVGCSPWVTKSQTRLSDFTFTFHFHELEKEMATHPSVLAWRIPGIGSHRVGHDRSDLAVAVWRRKCRFNPWVGKIPWRRAWLPPLVFWPG